MIDWNKSCKDINLLSAGQVLTWLFMISLSYGLLWFWQFWPTEFVCKTESAPCPWLPAAQEPAGSVEACCSHAVFHLAAGGEQARAGAEHGRAGSISSSRTCADVEARTALYILVTSLVTCFLKLQCRCPKHFFWVSSCPLLGNPVVILPILPTAQICRQFC